MQEDNAFKEIRTNEKERDLVVNGEKCTILFLYIHIVLDLITKSDQ